MSSSGSASMATASSISSNKKDPAWKYNHLKDPKDTNAVTCNFCGKVTKGGIYRAKQHQIGKFKNAASCTKCPPEVKEELEGLMAVKKKVNVDASLRYGVLPL